MTDRLVYVASLGAVAIVTVMSCGGSGGSPTAPSANVPFSTTDLKVGEGVAAANGNNVSVVYTGWLYTSGPADNKGAIFDSNTAANPFTFFIGIGQVIPGWDQGIPGMKVGGRRRIVIPPNMAYGQSGTGSIPGNSTLIFEVELLGIN